jgi:hypothetical protein
MRHIQELSPALGHVGQVVAGEQGSIGEILDPATAEALGQHNFGALLESDLPRVTAPRPGAMMTEHPSEGGGA